MCLKTATSAFCFLKSALQELKDSSALVLEAALLACHVYLQLLLIANQLCSSLVPSSIQRMW